MLNFCTLFDSYYLSRGLAMYESLRKNCPDFHLYIFPFDETSHHILQELRLEQVTLVKLEEFETPELLAVKPSRTKGEYCWTCTSSTIYHCLSTFGLKQCTYLDADLFFFSNPAVLLEEMEQQSVLITEHRYTPEYSKAIANGIYCVQFISFKNDENGLKALAWWRDRCIEWCFSRAEDGKFGDQKYLDDWPQRFQGVHVLRHLGGGVAPWNVQQYIIENTGGHYTLADRKKSVMVDLTFYHFHWVRFIDEQHVDLGFYKLDLPHVLEIYKMYLSALLKVEMNLEKQFQFKLKRNRPTTAQQILAVLYYNVKRRISGTYNVIDVSNF